MAVGTNRMEGISDGLHQRKGHSNGTSNGTTTLSYATVNGGSPAQEAEKAVNGQHKAEGGSDAGGQDVATQKNGHHNGHQQEDIHAHHHGSPSTLTSYLAMLALIYISWATYPGTLNVGDGTTIGHVWYYGWITALSTGLGTLPFLIVSDMNKWWLGISNATACGMMLAASTSLVYEGLVLETDHDYFIPQSVRVLIGLVTGLLFIISTKRLLDQHEDIKVAGLDGLEARKVLLLIFVMTLHSFTEGVGIGVSFGGKKGAQLGVFISATLAVHNVPEGLAVALVMVPRRVSKLNSALWCIFTSIPQPLMAVPAYLFIEQFIPFLPVGLGFAAGAMFWVAVVELLLEAVEDTESWITTGTVVALAFSVMMGLQQLIKDM